MCCKSIGPCVSCVCDIISEYLQKPYHLCQIFIKFDALLHITHRGAASTKTPRLNKFRSITLLSKIARLWCDDTFCQRKFLGETSTFCKMNEMLFKMFWMSVEVMFNTPVERLIQTFW